MHAFEEISQAQKETEPHKKTGLKEDKHGKDVSMSRINNGYPEASYPTFNERSIYYAQGSASMSNIVQRKISVTLNAGEHVPQINVNGSRSDFRKPVDSLYKGDSIAHVIPYETIQKSMKEILSKAVAKNANEPHPDKEEEFYIYDNDNEKADMRRLIKAVIPSAGYQFDIHEGLKLGPKIQEQQNEAKEMNEVIFRTSPTNAGALQAESNKLLSLLNSSYANLRRGDTDMNSRIGSNLDPIAAASFDQMFDSGSRGQIGVMAGSSYQVSQGGMEAQIGVHLESATINELSLAKRMHKMGQLRNKYPSLTVLGIFSARETDTGSTVFYSSEMHYAGKKAFKNTHDPLSLHTHVAHIKGKGAEKWEHDFTGESHRPSKVSTAIPFASHMAPLMETEAEGSDTINTEMPDLVEDKKKAEEIKLRTAAEQKHLLDSEAGEVGISENVDYINMCARYDGYYQSYERFIGGPISQLTIAELDDTYRNFHMSKLPVIVKIEEAKRFAAAAVRKQQIDEAKQAADEADDAAADAAPAERKAQINSEIDVRNKRHKNVCKHYLKYKKAYDTFMITKFDRAVLGELNQSFLNFQQNVNEFEK